MSTQLRQPPPLPNIIDQPPITDQEIPAPIPHIQTEYTFLSDDTLQHTIPQLEASFIDGAPQSIHYDVFAGINVNNFVLDPFQFIYDQTKMGQPFLDAEDAALFPPEVLEDLMKDRKNKAILPPLDDIVNAKKCLLNTVNHFSPQAPDEEDELADSHSKKAKKLQLVKPYQFESDHRNIAIMQSAQQNALNFYYNVVYTEDTLQTWRDKRNYQKAVQIQQLEAEKDEVLFLREKLDTDKYSSDVKYAVDVKNRKNIIDHIEDSFAAMNEEPIHPTKHSTAQCILKTPFFPASLHQFAGSSLPSHINGAIAGNDTARDQLNADNELCVMSGTKEANFGSKYIIQQDVHFKTVKQYKPILADDMDMVNDNKDKQTAPIVMEEVRVKDFELWSLYHRKNKADMAYEPIDNVYDQDTSIIMTKPVLTGQIDDVGNQIEATDDSAEDKYTYVWERLVETIPVQPMSYEDSMIARLDPVTNEYYFTQVRQKYRFKPRTTRRHIKKIADTPRIITVNHPDYIHEAIARLQLPDEDIAEATTHGYDDDEEYLLHNDDADDEEAKKSKKDHKKDKKDKKTKKSKFSASESDVGDMMNDETE